MGWHHTQRDKSLSTRRIKASDLLDIIWPAIKSARRRGESWQYCADLLNELGFRTNQGKPWTRGSLYKFCKSAGIG